MSEVWGIRANHADGDPSISGDDGRNKRGAACWLLYFQGGGGGENNPMVCRSRGGRLIRKWVAARKCDNWRVAFVPPGTIRDQIVGYPTKEAAQAELDRVKAMLDGWRTAALAKIADAAFPPDAECKTESVDGVTVHSVSWPPPPEVPARNIRPAPTDTSPKPFRRITSIRSA